MKCDELKPLVFSLNELSFIDESAVQKNFENLHDHAVYKATEVDDAIAELKRKLQDQCISCPVKMQEDDVVAELKQNLENAQASAYAESVDAGMRERRLKRALYKAIANWAKVTKIWDGSRPSDDFDKWFKVELKCLKKSEEYK